MNRYSLEKQLHVLFPRLLHLHHIDCNRNNNDISNFILLDHKTHNRVHYIIKTKPALKNKDDLLNYLFSNNTPRYMLKIADTKEFKEANATLQGNAAPMRRHRGGKKNGKTKVL